MADRILRTLEEAAIPQQGSPQIWRIEAVARARDAMGDHARALSILSEAADRILSIRDLPIVERARALEMLAENQVSVGDFAGSRQTLAAVKEVATHMTSSPRLPQLEENIVWTEAQGADPAAAVASVQGKVKPSDPRLTDRILRTAAFGFARQDNWPEAMTTARTIQEPQAKLYALLGLARLRAGLPLREDPRSESLQSGTFQFRP
jgi:hypothetical protein